VAAQAVVVEEEAAAPWEAEAALPEAAAAAEVEQEAAAVAVGAEEEAEVAARLATRGRRPPGPRRSASPGRS
jgi:hypothetical protein